MRELPPQQPEPTQPIPPPQEMTLMKRWSILGVTVTKRTNSRMSEWTIDPTVALIFVAAAVLIRPILNPLSIRIHAIRAAQECRRYNFDGVENSWQTPFDCSVSYTGTDGVRQNFVVGLNIAADYATAAARVKATRLAGGQLPPSWGYRDQTEEKQCQPEPL